MLLFYFGLLKGLSKKSQKSSSLSSLGILSIGGSEGGVSSGVTLSSAIAAWFFCTLGLGLGFFTFIWGGGFSALGVISFGSWSFQFAVNKIKIHQELFE